MIKMCNTPARCPCGQDHWCANMDLLATLAKMEQSAEWASPLYRCCCGGIKRPWV